MVETLRAGQPQQRAEVGSAAGQCDLPGVASKDGWGSADPPSGESTASGGSGSGSGAWVDSDSWYALTGSAVPAEEAPRFFNVRTGTTSVMQPDGTRDGVRLRSAAATGPWAVPLASSAGHPDLPRAVFAPLDCALLAPEVVTFGGSNAGSKGAADGCCTGRPRLVFTAPHGVNLERDGKPEHLPEDFTSYLAKAWAAHAAGASVCWGGAALAWCFQNERPLPGARDPNYLTEEEADANAWVQVLEVLGRPLPDLAPPPPGTADSPIDLSDGESGRPDEAGPLGLHIDVHGKADRAGEADCDVGVGALRASAGDAVADEVADIVAAALCAALGREAGHQEAGHSGNGSASPHSVDARPRLQGCWRSVPRRTLTQSSVRLGYVPIQLEVGYNLRRALGRDRSLCTSLAEAFVACEPLCLAACRSKVRCR